MNDTMNPTPLLDNRKEKHLERHICIKEYIWNNDYISCERYE